MIHTVSGNLLNAKADALVNTVNCVGVMGKGIALQFKQAFPAMFADYRRASRAGEVKPGQMYIYSTGALWGPHFIINFPTKRHWQGRSRMEDIDAGLCALAARVRELGIRSIAIPPLGVGNGGLPWGDVRPRIVAAFEALPEVKVLLYEPLGEPPAHARRVAETPVKLTLASALSLRLMHLYGLPGYALTMLEVQKLAYLLQEAGQPLRLEYKPHLYGPFANELMHVLRRIEGHFLDIDRAASGSDVSPTAEIRLRECAPRSAADFLVGYETERARLKQVAKLIEGYETPHSMELLATVHWVAAHDPASRSNVDACIHGVYTWPMKRSRKRRLFSEHHIRMGWERLKDYGWF